MNLDDRDLYRRLDTQAMCAHIDRLPDQLQSAWDLGQGLPLPASLKAVDRIIISGMGGSGLSAELAAALVYDSSPIPVIAHRSYDLPAYASGPKTLVVAVSHSGNTEETLNVADQATARGTQILSITTGGTLADKTQAAGQTVWRFAYASEPRAALGWSLGLLVALMSRLELASGLSEAVAESVQNLRERVNILGMESPAVKNPAKRLAGQFIGRVPIIHGAGLLAPVARRWKTQLNENAKSVAQCEEMPDMNHNTIEGISFPPPVMTKIAVVFLAAQRSTAHGATRIARRFDLTKQLYLQQGIAPDTVKARGTSSLAQAMSLIQFGDYVSYYTAIAYGVDPTPVNYSDELKEKLTAISEVQH